MNRDRKTRGKSMHLNRGFILITSYLLLSVLSIFSLALFSRSNAHRVTIERNKNRIVAFNMAEAGLDLALTQLATNPAYTGTNGYVSMDTNTVRGGYQVTVTVAANNPNVRQIATSGFSPSNVNTTRGYETRAITSFAQLGASSNYDHAVFARNSVQMSGNALLDSYDSRLGPYQNQVATNRGHLGTNNNRAGFVMISGNANVKGNVTVGPGAPLTVTKSGNAQADAPTGPGSVITMSGNSIIQSVGGLSEPKTFAPVTPPPTNLGALNLSGNTIQQLQSGAYRYSSMSITGNAQLVPLGPVQIYVDGTVNVAGNGIVTVENKPSNLFLYSTGTATVKLSGNGNFYGVVHSPNSEVQHTGNGHIYGAVLSNNYHESGNGKVHYDEALKALGGNSQQGVDLLSWRENNTIAGGGSA